MNQLSEFFSSTHLVLNSKLIHWCSSNQHCFLRKAFQVPLRLRFFWLRCWQVNCVGCCVSLVMLGELLAQVFDVDRRTRCRPRLELLYSWLFRVNDHALSLFIFLFDCFSDAFKPLVLSLFFLLARIFKFILIWVVLFWIFVFDILELPLLIWVEFSVEKILLRGLNKLKRSNEGLLHLL